MDDRREDQTQADGTAEAVPALVEAQLETARAEVFRAYLSARDKARALADDDHPKPADRQRRPS